MALYVYAVIIISVFTLPFVWYVGHTAFSQFQIVGSQLIVDLGTNSTQSDFVEEFFSNADTYMLVLALIGITLWAFVYSQKRGEPVYGY